MDTAILVIGALCALLIVYLLLSQPTTPPADSCGNKCTSTQTCQDSKCIDTVCTKDGDCATGQFCASGGVCANIEPCYSELDCASGQICSSGACISDPNCYADTDCVSGQMCFNGQCVAKPQCYVDTDCPDLQICNSGSCQANPNCATTRECGDDGFGRSCGTCDAGNTCVNGKCTTNPPVPVFSLDAFYFTNTTKGILLWSVDYSKSIYRSHHVKFHATITHMDPSGHLITDYDGLINSHEMERGAFFPILDYTQTGAVHKHDFKKKLYTNADDLNLEKFNNYTVSLMTVGDNGAQSNSAICALNYLL
jgi:hypothetical protein